MEKGNQNWDSERLSQEFLTKAKACERYLDEIRTKLHVTRSFELIFDEALAEFYLFNSLHGKPFLATRDQLLAGLRGLLKVEVPRVLGILISNGTRWSGKTSSKASSADLRERVKKKKRGCLPAVGRGSELH